MPDSTSPRWRLWLIAILSAFGVITALGAAALLLLVGLGSWFTQAEGMQTVPLLNMAWASALVGILCFPALRLAVNELGGKTSLVKPSQLAWLYASLGLLLWVPVALLFEPVETSNFAPLLLPPLVLLATALPLWWYLETGRRDLPGNSRLNQWGLTSISLTGTLPVVMILELTVMLVIVLVIAVYATSQPALMAELERLAALLNNTAVDPQILEDLAAQFLQQPAVVAGILILASLIIPLIEEMFKPLAVWLFAGSRLTPAQGFEAGMISGACFALLENLTALSTAGDGSGTITLIGRLGAGLLHITTSGLLGWALAAAWQERKRWLRLVGVYLAMVGLHGLWNAFGLLAGAAPFLQIGDELQTGVQWLGNAATFGLVGLIVLNFILLNLMNRRLRREAAVISLNPPQNSVEME